MLPSPPGKNQNENFTIFCVEKLWKPVSAALIAR